MKSAKVGSVVELYDFFWAAELELQGLVEVIEAKDPQPRDRFDYRRAPETK